MGQDGDKRGPSDPHRVLVGRVQKIEAGPPMQLPVGWRSSDVDFDFKTTRATRLFMICRINQRPEFHTLIWDFSLLEVGELRDFRRQIAQLIAAEVERLELVGLAF
jgi:hypothetical protein